MGNLFRRHRGWDQRGPDRTRGDAIDPNSLVSQQLGQTRREIGNSAFRSRVGEKLRRRGFRIYRGGIDDGAAGLEVRQCRLRQVKHAVDVGTEGVIPLRVSDLFDALVGRLEGGVVDKNVEPPKSLQSLGSPTRGQWVESATSPAIVTARRPAFSTQCAVSRAS